MSDLLLINSLEFAEQSLEIHDKIRASNLPGLRDVVFSDRRELEFRLVGENAGRDKLFLHLTVTGALDLQCQRCLGELVYPVAVDRRFELIADESALPDSDMDDDEVDYLVVDPKMDVVALVEQEVVLALPMAVRHENECSGSLGQDAVLKPNPFRVLEGLKSGNKN